MPGSIADTVTLSNGVKMPLLGFGTFQIPEGPTVEQSVQWALELGYRHIDTAAAYHNEQGVGNAIRRSGVPREKIFITTKVWNQDVRGGRDAVAAAVDKSLKLLGTDYADLFLLHWPIKGKDKEAWQVLEKAYSDGRAKAIGVSNYLVHHLQDLLPSAQVKPMVNQVEFHPWLMQKDLLELEKKHKIVPEAWAPLMQGKAWHIPELNDIAKARGKSMAQILLRWDIQHGVVTIPKSTHRERIAENAAIYDFELTPAEMAKLDALDQRKRIGSDPDNFKF